MVKKLHEMGKVYEGLLDRGEDEALDLEARG
jgi:hypothetical protein